MVLSFDQEQYELMFSNLDDYLGELVEMRDAGKAETRAAVEQLLKRVEDGVFWED